MKPIDASPISAEVCEVRNARFVASAKTVFDLLKAKNAPKELFAIAECLAPLNDACIQKPDGEIDGEFLSEMAERAKKIGALLGKAPLKQNGVPMTDKALQEHLKAAMEEKLPVPASVKEVVPDAVD